MDNTVKYGEVVDNPFLLLSQESPKKMFNTSPMWFQSNFIQYTLDRCINFLETFKANSLILGPEIIKEESDELISL